MHDDAIELAPAGRPTPSPCGPGSSPVSTAFADDYTDAMFDIDRQLWEQDRLIGAVDGDAWVAGASAFSMRLTVPGGTVRAAGLSDVGVAPTHRRRGILTGMMRWLLDQAVERGEPVSILHASEGAIYPHFGFGLATLQGTFEADRSAIRFAPAAPNRSDACGSSRATRRCGSSRPIFEAVVGDRVGEVSRTPEKWRLQLLADDPWRQSDRHQVHAPCSRSAASRAATPSTANKSEWGDRGPKSVLTVVEVTALDPAAERALWDWLAGIDLVRKVVAWRTARAAPAVPPGRGPAPARAHGRRRPLGPAGRPAGGARGALVRGPGGSTLEVTDAFMPVERGPLDAARAGRPGEAAVVRAADRRRTRPRARHVDLATVYLGAFTFADLARAGRLGECRDGAVAAADRSSRRPGSPASTTMF